jgi:hypothetical protein
MSERALGLFQQDYRSKMFSRSPNKRWVIYERRRLPCLIDTRNHSEELLGWTPEHEQQLFRPRLWGGTFNSPLGDSVLWHPRKELVAFRMVSAGRSRPLAMWAWQPRTGIRRLEYRKIDEATAYEADWKGWKGDELQFRLATGDTSNLIGWNVSKNTFRVIPR